MKYETYLPKRHFVEVSGKAEPSKPFLLIITIVPYTGILNDLL